MKWVNI